MKVFIIYLGDYSSRHAVGVVSTKEKAEAIKDRYLKTAKSDDDWYWQSCDIEEWEVDSENILGCAELSTFSVLLYPETGDLYSIYLEDPGDEIDKNMATWKSGEEEFLTVYVRARDKAHAIKIAGEKRTAYKLKQAGI